MKKTLLALLLTLVVAVALLPETPRIPVSGATAADWNPQSFWYYPWGRSGTHKGIDIFAPGRHARLGSDARLGGAYRGG